MSELDIILDNSRLNLDEVPIHILHMRNLKMLYLQQNFIKEIPKDFFQKLPLLTWLDLRGNRLTSLPREIAHHQHLENFLLSDNKIEVLPNELGLLPKLKVLQIANNPLGYPNAKVVAEGTKAVVTFLRQQYELEIPPSEDKKEETEEDKEVRIEKEIRVMVDYCDEFFPVQSSISSNLIVKGLSNVKKDENAIVHKITSSPNKILLRSYYDEDDRHVRASTQTTDSISYIPSAYKQTWVEKLKQLLDQQEKILQQERNLQALTSWREEKKNEPTRPISGEEYRKPPPYATDPKYDTMLSREDMHKEIDKMIQYSKNPPKRTDVEKLIADLVSQLKDMETSYGGLENPRNEIEAAGNQIMKIMEMHKKIVKLRETNDLLLQ